MITIREATPSDVDQIVSTGDSFFNESNFREFDYDSEQCAYWIGYMAASETDVVLVAVDENDKLMGFLIFDITRFYTKQLMAHMFLFYVFPEYRNTGLAVRLLKRAEEIATERGAARFYASSSAGFADDGKMDKKLLDFYLRSGYSELGCFVMKGLGADVKN